MSNGRDAQSVLIDEIDQVIGEIRNTASEVACSAHPPLASGVIVLLKCERVRQQRVQGEELLEHHGRQESRRDLKNFLIRCAIACGFVCLGAVAAAIMPNLTIWTRLLEVFKP